jgi:hypothetical protein
MEVFLTPLGKTHRADVSHPYSRHMGRGRRRTSGRAQAVARPELTLISLDDETLMWQDPNGNYHCENGPAILRADGSYAYFWHGLPHRLDGPALLLSNGRRVWYLNGIAFTKAEWTRHIARKQVKHGADLTLQVG